MRLPDRSRGLWIDCKRINQSNEKRESHQVGIISLMYSKAGCVIVWLVANITDNLLWTFPWLRPALTKKTGNPDDEGIRIKILMSQ
jgi:hypothetical protein